MSSEQEMVEVTIKVPKPPEGFEVVGPGHSDCNCWALTETGWFIPSKESYWGCLARRKQTLAGWMNEQPDFQVLARLCRDWFSVEVKNGKWVKGWTGSEFNWPNSPMNGKAKTHKGKWVDV